MMDESHILKQKVLIFTISLLILGVFPGFILIYSYYRDYTNNRDVFVTEQTEALEHYAGMIERELNSVMTDLEYIYLSPNFQNYLMHGIGKEIVEEDWKTFSQSQRVYDQIRFIDPQGMEKIRINFNEGDTQIVPQEKLQNKADRYYFSLLGEFSHPTILLSKIDLNKENGEIELPHKPMLRVSLPLYNDNGDSTGAIVLNYLASHILDRLKFNFINEGNRVFILNEEDYILLGPREEDRWGFMLDTEKTFSHLYESDWERLSLDDANVYQSEVGLYLNRTINSMSLLAAESEETAFKDYQFYSMDEKLRVIILSEMGCKSLFCKNFLGGIIDKRWKLLAVLSLLSVGISLVITQLYMKKDLAERLKDQYKTAMKEVVKALEYTTSLEDDDTGNHIKRVCHYSRILASASGLSSDEVELIADLASLHDIGKVGVHDSILKKRGVLTEQEREEMKTHVTFGYDLIKKMKMDQVASNIALYHHENWDSSGYNYGLFAEEIPLEARIVAIADVYDALRSRRSYKRAFTHEEARTVILSEKGKKFDPIMVDLFLERERDFDDISLRYRDPVED